LVYWGLKRANERESESALSSLNRWKGRRRAAFWRALGFPNLMRAGAALANKVRLRPLEEWKREELKRTPLEFPFVAELLEGAPTS
jgi:hypothetical protein